MNGKMLSALAALGFTPAESDDATPVSVPGFDGGARASLPLAPESHGAWLLRLLAGEVAPSSRE